MKHTARLIMTVILTAAFFALAPVPVSAEITVPEKQTVYLDPTGSTFIPFEVTGIPRRTKVTSIKSSNKKVLDVEFARRVDRKTSDNFSKGKKLENVYESALEIDVTAKRKGTATLSFKAGGKTYKTVFRVRKYKNPAKSIRFTGVRTGSLKKLFAKSRFASYGLKKSGKAGKLKVVPAEGWKVRSVLFSDINGDRRWSMEGAGLSSARLTVPALKKGRLYEFRIVFENARTGGTEELVCSLY